MYKSTSYRIYSDFVIISLLEDTVHGPGSQL